MNEFILLDAAVWHGHPRLDALMQSAHAVALYADFSSPDAARFGPWLLDAGAFNEHHPPDDPLDLPWRYGISRLTTDASRNDLVMHLESQRSLAMEAGERRIPGTGPGTAILRALARTDALAGGFRHVDSTEMRR